MKSLYQTFTEALQLDDSSSQEAFLRECYHGDPDTLSEALALLEAHHASTDSFEIPFAVLPELTAAREATIDELEYPYDFGDYIIRELLGTGGMGVVYRATHKKLNRLVALKMIRDAHLATRQQVNRFHSEAQAAATLNHPGIVPIYEVGKVEKQHFFAMAFIDGLSLSEAVVAKQVTLAQSIEIITQISEAADYAHQHGLVHRDLKPENILLSPAHPEPSHPSHYRAQIVDFGLAKRIDQEGELTADGALIGTPSYMAPEQASGDNSNISTASDIHAIGALLYFSLSGHPPYQGENSLHVLQAVQEKEPPPLSGIPRDIETICLKCLEKKPQHRYAKAKEIAHDLENHLQNRPLIAKRPSLFTRILKLCQRSKAATIAALMTAVLIATGFFFSTEIKRLTKGFSQDLDDASLVLKQEKARSELALAVQLLTSENQQELTAKLQSAVTLAQEAKDPLTERLARYQLDALSHSQWTPTEPFALPPQTRNLLPSPNLQEIASFSEDKTLSIQNLTNGSILLESTLSHAPSAFAFHPSGQYFLAGTSEGTIHIWKRIEQTFVPEAPINTESCHQIRFDLTGSTLIQTSANKLLFWDFNKRKRTRSLITHPSDIFKPLVAPEKQLVLCLSQDGTLTGWNIDTGTLKFGPLQLNSKITDAAINPSGSRLAIITSHQNLQLFDLSELSAGSQKSPKLLSETNSGRTYRVVFGSRSQEIFTLDGSETIKNQRTRSLKSPQRLSNFFLSTNEQSLLTLNIGSSQLQKWQAPTQNKFIPPLRSTSQSPILLSQFDTPLAYLEQRRINIFPSPEALTQEPRRNLPPKLQHYRGSLRAAIAHPSQASFFLLRDEDGPNITWVNATDGHPIWQSPSLTHFPSAMKVSSEQNILAMLSSDQHSSQLAIIDLTKKTLTQHQIPHPDLINFCFSSKSNTSIVLSSQTDELLWFDWKKDEITLTARSPQPKITALTSTPSKDLIIIGSESGHVTAYRENDLTPLSPQISHPTPVSLITILDQGRLIASGGGNKTIKIWEITSGQTIGLPLTHHAPVNILSGNLTSPYLLTATTSGQVHTWPVPRASSQISPNSQD